jgi:hypothetical protein
MDWRDDLLRFLDDAEAAKRDVSKLSVLRFIARRLDRDESDLLPPEVRKLAPDAAFTTESEHQSPNILSFGGRFAQERGTYEEVSYQPHNANAAVTASKVVRLFVKMGLLALQTDVKQTRRTDLRLYHFLPALLD